MVVQIISQLVLHFMSVEVSKLCQDLDELLFYCQAMLSVQVGSPQFVESL